MKQLVIYAQYTILGTNTQWLNVGHAGQHSSVALQLQAEIGCLNFYRAVEALHPPAESQACSSMHLSALQLPAEVRVKHQQVMFAGQRI